MGKTTRCLLLCNESFTAFKFLLPHARYLAGKGIIADIACSDKEYEDAKSFVKEIQESGIRWHRVTIERRIKPLKDTLTLIALTLFLKRSKYDIVHTHSSKAGVLGRLAAKIAGVPVIVHSTYDYAFTEQTNGVTRSLYVIAEKLAAAVARRIYFISESEHARCFKYNIARAGKTLNIGPVGLNAAEFSLERFTEKQRDDMRRRYGLERSSAVVGTIARLVEHKGIDVFIKAAALVVHEHPRCTFIVVGGGPLLAALQAQVSSLGLENNFIFTGFIREQKDIPLILSLFDVFILPTRKEGFGIVFAEAGVLEKPVIGCDIGPVNAIIKHGVTGYLVPVDDDGQFARYIGALLKNERLRARMGMAGKKRAINLFEGSIAYGRMYRDYLEILAQAGVR